MNKRMWSLTRASFLELIRDPMVTGLAMLFPLAFIGMYLILPDLRITPQLTISALAFGLPSIILLGALALGLTGTAAPMVQHRRDGALRNIGMTPITPAMYLGAQVPARVVVIVAETLLILAIAALTGTLRISDPGCSSSRSRCASARRSHSASSSGRSRATPLSWERWAGCSSRGYSSSVVSSCRSA